MLPINYVAVLVATVVAIVLGHIWYGPLFGKKWMALAGVSQDGMKPKASTIVGMIISSLVMAYVLSAALLFASAYLNASGVYAGVMVGFWNWLGFIAPVTFGMVLWERKPIKLWCIVAGYYLVSLVCMGIVLALWM